MEEGRGFRERASRFDMDDHGPPQRGGGGYSSFRQGPIKQENEFAFDRRPLLQNQPLLHPVKTEIKQESASGFSGPGARPQQGRKRSFDERGPGFPEQRPPKRGRDQPPGEDEDGDFDDTLVVLDTYNCDLHFKIEGDRCTGYPLTMEGFAYLWSGGRATYGAAKGRVCFEMKILEEIAVKHLPATEPDPHVVRIGWSLDSCSTQLGEEPFSYGYGGTGKKSQNCKFENYGEPFAEHDVIGCYLDFESKNGIEMLFTKNGKNLGIAYKIKKETLSGKALFPHVLVKNCSVEFNFGQKDEPFFPILPGYNFLQHVALYDRVRGSVGPKTKADCEILMMVGLPGAGKTTWAMKHAAANPEKKYNILGTNTIMDKMKVMGLRRQRNYAGRWDVLIQQATGCLNKHFQIASRKKRNYILDQTNVYPNAQKRKMRPFEGFQRKGVVICPTDEDLQDRIIKRTDEEGKDVPDSAVLEMKANYTLPVAGEFLNDVIYIEVQKEEAEVLVKQYNEEGKRAGPNPEKRFGNRGGAGGGGGNFRGRGGGGFNRGAPEGIRGGLPGRGGRGGGEAGDGGRGGFRGGFNRGGDGGSYNTQPSRWGNDSRDNESGGRGGFESGSRGGFESGGRGGFQSGGRSGFQSGGRGGFESGGRGGFDSGSRGGSYSAGGRGGSGYDSGSRGGGYDSGSRGGGSYDSGSRGGGYDSGSRGGGSYDSGSRGSGGYDSGSRGSGGYDSGSRGGGGYDSGSRGGGGYDSGSRGGGGYDSGSRGGGGYDTGSRGGGGSYDSGSRSGGYDSENRSGGYDSENRGGGGADSGSRGGSYDSGSRGGSYDSGSRGGGYAGVGAMTTIEMEAMTLAAEVAVMTEIANLHKATVRCEANHRRVTVQYGASLHRTTVQYEARVDTKAAAPLLLLVHLPATAKDNSKVMAKDIINLDTAKVEVEVTEVTAVVVVVVVVVEVVVVDIAKDTRSLLLLVLHLQFRQMLHHQHLLQFLLQDLLQLHRATAQQAITSRISSTRSSGISTTRIKARHLQQLQLLLLPPLRARASTARTMEAMIIPAVPALNKVMEDNSDIDLV